MSTTVLSVGACAYVQTCVVCTQWAVHVHAWLHSSYKAGTVDSYLWDTFCWIYLVTTQQNYEQTPVFQMWSHSCSLEISQTTTCSSTPVPPSAGRIPPAVCSGSTVAPDTHNWLIMSVIYCTSLYSWGVRLTNALLHSRKIASAWTCSGLTVFSPNCVTG